MTTDVTLTFDEHLRSLLEIMAGEGIHQAARGLSGMMGETLTVSQPRARLVPLADIPNVLGGPENEAVGIYLQAYGAMSGQIVLVLPYAKALELADLVVGLPLGTTRQLGSLERSALAEVGNLAAAFFLNAVASLTGLGARPSPPAVMVDMIGAILDVVIATSGGVAEQVLMLQATFLSRENEVEVDFWVIPDPEALEAFALGERGHGRFA